MSNPPFYYLKAWRNGDKKALASILTFEEYLTMVGKPFTTLHSFTGLTATVCVLSHRDDNLIRVDKLKIAIDFMRGHYVQYDVNLDKLTVTTTYGKPPPGY